MSVFDRCEVDQLNDECVLYDASIVAFDSSAGHTVFTIEVTSLLCGHHKWTLRKRYSDFAALHDVLKKNFYAVDLPRFPAKKIRGNLVKGFVEDRMMALQLFMNSSLLASLPLMSSSPVRLFFDPKSRIVNLPVQALDVVSMCLRSIQHWQLVEQCKEIGWRLRKTYFLVKPVENKKLRHMLCWHFSDPSCGLEGVDLQRCSEWLVNIQHPWIVHPAYVWCSDRGGLTVRNFYAEGTIRDLHYQCKPQHTYLKKYISTSHNVIVNIDACFDVRRIAKQVLQSLQYLHGLGVPYGNLHCGNLVWLDDACLLDIEAAIFGLKSIYWPYAVQVKTLHTMEQLDVYCFGQTLFELCFGRSLNSAFLPEDFSIPQSPHLTRILRSILLESCNRLLLPTVLDLLNDAFFDQISLQFVPPNGLKPSTEIASLLALCKQKMESKLEAENKQFRQMRKMSQTHAIINSDEERAKRRTAAKKSLIEATTSGSCSVDT